MSIWTSLLRSPIVKVLYNHNPFYVISAALVLYGLQVSFAHDFQPTQGWLLLELLGGYTFLLALSGVLIVRVGNVWEDARTVILTTLLLIIALSSSFDRICLDSTREAIPFLAWGYVGALTLTELMPLALGVRLDYPFRRLLHLHWILYFSYPLLLGYLSISDREAIMSWLVLLFPTFGALLLLLLLPLLHRENHSTAANGTPWRWPWFPAPLFVFLAAGYVVRGYGLSASFELGEGYAGGFQAYFAIPLLLAGAVLIWELARLRHRTHLQASLCWIPMSLLLLALPGPGRSGAQRHFNSMLIDTIGAPVVVTVVLLVAYYAYLYIRGERRAVHWAIILVIFSAFLNPDTIGFSSLRATPHPWLAIGSGGVLCFMGIRQERLKQLLAGTAVLLIGISSKYFPHWNFEQVLYVLLHGTLVTSYGLSLVYDDRFARWICRTAPRYIGSLAFVIACGYPILWRELPVVTHAWLLAMVVLLSWLHWWRSPILRRFIASIQAASWLTAMGIGRVAWGVLHASELRGIRFLVGGVLLLTVGLAISLLKGGGYRRWLQTLYMVNRQREADFRV